MHTENSGVVRSTGVIGGATFVGRVLGYVRDMTIAALFGASTAADAFFVAFRVPSVPRRLLSEGALSAAFVPTFTETLDREGEARAWELVGTTFAVFAVALVGVCCLGVALAPQIAAVLAPGLAASAGGTELTAALLRWMFPAVLFIGLAAVAMGALNSLRHFAAPALAPALMNVSIIALALFLAPDLPVPVMALAYGVLLGSFLQLAFQIPFLRWKGAVLRARLRFRDPDLARMLRLLVPSVLGLAATEINIVIDFLLASLLPAGSISYLYYGSRLVQFPLGVSAMALGTAILPVLSLQASRGWTVELRETFSFGLRLALFLTLPAMLGLIVLRGPIVSLLFQRGEFTAADTVASSQALLCYAVGLWAYAGVKIAAPVFCAFQDTRYLVRIAALAVGANVVLSLILMGPLQHAGLALGTSLAAAVNLAGLAYGLRRRLGSIGWAALLPSLGKAALASVVMALVAYGIAHAAGPAEGASMARQLLALLGAILGGGICYLLLSHLLGSEELSYLLEAARREPSAG